MTSPARAPATVLHALPGRLRVHLPPRSEAELRRLVITLQALPAVRSARATPLTGTVLVHFDARALDTATLEALICAPPRTPAASRTRGVARERRWEKRVALRRRSRPTSRGRTRATTATPPPRPTRVLWPLIHLLFCASPLGLALHVGEVCWAVWPFVIRRGTRAPFRGRLAMVPYDYPRNVGGSKGIMSLHGATERLITTFCRPLLLWHCVRTTPKRTRAPGVPVSPVVGDNGRAAHDRRWLIAS